MALGFYWAAWLAQLALAPQLALADEGRDITVVGTVASLPYQFQQGVRFNFAVESAAGAVVPPLIALSWYAGFRDEITNEVGDVQPGERWQLTVRLQRPHGNANPHGFDYEVWLLEQGVRATGYVRPAPRLATPNVRLDSFVPGFSNVVQASRAALRARIMRSLQGQRICGRDRGAGGGRPARDTPVGLAGIQPHGREPPDFDIGFAYHDDRRHVRAGAPAPCGGAPFSPTGNCP